MKKTKGKTVKKEKPKKKTEKPKKTKKGKSKKTASKKTKKKINPKDLRKHKRVKTLIPITVRVTKVEDETQDFYFTKDLSLGGVFLKTDDKIPIGAIIDMELSIHGVNELIKIRGKVVRVGHDKGKREGIGVEFLDMDDGSNKGLKVFLAEE